MHKCTTMGYDSGKSAPRQGETEEKIDALSRSSPGIACRVARRGVVRVEGSAGLSPGAGPRGGVPSARLPRPSYRVRPRPTSVCWLGNRLVLARIGECGGEVGSLLRTCDDATANVRSADQPDGDQACEPIAVRGV